MSSSNALASLKVKSVKAFGKPVEDQSENTILALRL